MNAMTNQETDTALILENELQRRVKQILGGVVQEVVNQAMERRFAQQKEAMLLEVALSVGKMFKVMEQEGRKPLWDATPEEFGLTEKDLATHALGRKEGSENPKLDNAIGVI
jgi:hypothetical protein